jgi:hypothetical protein
MFINNVWPQNQDISDTSIETVLDKTIGQSYYFLN